MPIDRHDTTDGGPDQRWAAMTTGALRWRRWEKRLGSSIQLAVIARRPGSNARTAGVFVAVAAVCAAVAYAIYRVTGYAFVSLLPVAALSAARPRPSTLGPSEVALPFMVNVVVTGDSVVFATYNAGFYGELGAVALSVAHRDIAAVATGTNRKHVRVELVDGRTATVSVGRRRDRDALIEALGEMVRRREMLPAVAAGRHGRPIIDPTPTPRPSHAVPPGRRGDAAH